MFFKIVISVWFNLYLRTSKTLRVVSVVVVDGGRLGLDEDENEEGEVHRHNELLGQGDYPAAGNSSSAAVLVLLVDNFLGLRRRQDHQQGKW